MLMYCDLWPKELNSRPVCCSRLYGMGPLLFKSTHSNIMIILIQKYNRVPQHRGRSQRYSFQIEIDHLQFRNQNFVNILFLVVTYRKKSEIWPRRTLGRNWEHWADIWDIGQILRTLSRHMGHWAEIGDIGQTLGRHWADIGQTLASSLFLIKQCKIRLYNSLM